MRFRYKSTELPSMPMNEDNWILEAECRDVEDPDIFFHPENQRGNQRQKTAARAIEICNSCPVIQECRDYATNSGQEFGIWGGMTEGELRLAVKDAAARRRLSGFSS